MITYNIMIIKIMPVKNLNTFKYNGVPHKTLPSKNLLIIRFYYVLQI